MIRLSWLFHRNACLLILFLTIVGCRKDNNEQNASDLTNRISIISRQIEQPGIVSDPLMFVFVYADGNNQLEGVSILNNNLDIVRVFLYDYQPDGRPRQLIEVDSDLTTILRTIDFRYNGGQLASIGTINFVISGGRVNEMGNGRFEYNNRGNVVRTVSNNPSTSGLVLTNNTFTNIRNPISAMFDRDEVALSLIHILQPIPGTDMVNFEMMSYSEILNSAGTVVERINFSTNPASNGFADSYRRIGQTDNRIVTFDFTYEKRE